MSCEFTRDHLDDFNAGTLDPAGQEAVRAHVASCAECAADLEAARFMAPRTAALPREKPADRDLWSGIEVRLEPRRSQARRVARASALAAALLLAVAAGWWLRGHATRDSRLVTDSRLVASEALPYGSEVASLRAAMNDLERALMEGGRLSPAVSEGFRRDLQTLEAAITEASAALRADPTNDVVRELYRAAFRRKLEALRRVAAVYSTS